MKDVFHGKENIIMYDKLCGVFIAITIIVIFAIAITSDIYNSKHYYIENCKIVYQNDPRQNYKKFCDIKFIYDNKVYTTQLFHGYIQLEKTHALFYIYINDEGVVYQVNFHSYLK